MKEIILEATDRIKQPGKFKEEGFVPGVLYGDGVDKATSVKFNTIALKKILSSHGSNAKVWINHNNSKKFGFVKEVQKDAVSEKIIHIDVQMVSKDHEIKLQLPIFYRGEEELKNRQLVMQTYKSEIGVFGKMALMPDTIYVDVSDKKLGDTITVSNFNLDSMLEINEKDDLIFGIVVYAKNQGVIEAEEIAAE